MSEKPQEPAGVDWQQDPTGTHKWGDKPTEAQRKARKEADQKAYEEGRGPRPLTDEEEANSGPITGEH